MSTWWGQDVRPPALAYVFCDYCQTALLPEHMRCTSCGAPRPEYRGGGRRKWPDYERRAVMMSTSIEMEWDTT